MGLSETLFLSVQRHLDPAWDYYDCKQKDSGLCGNPMPVLHPFRRTALISAAFIQLKAVLLILCRQVTCRHFSFPVDVSSLEICIESRTFLFLDFFSRYSDLCLAVQPSSKKLVRTS